MAVLFIGFSLTAHAKAMSVDGRVMIDVQEHQELLTERRLCRYERHECQLIGGL